MSDGLPEGWRLVPLDEVASIEDGRRVPLNSHQRASRRGPYPYFGANGQVDSIDEYRYEGDHVLVAEDGGYFDEPARGVAYSVSGKFWVNNHAHVLHPRASVDVTFLRDALNRVPWMEYVSGTTRLKLTQAALRRVELPVPPIDEQRRIVAKLDALRARSRRAKDALDAVPALLDRLRQSILAAAFRGDLTADWRAQNPDLEPACELLKRIRVERRKRWEEAELAKMVAKGKPPKDDRWKTKYVEPEPVDESELPELPEGWCWASVDDVAWSVRNGIAAKPEGTTGLPILRISAVRPLSLDLSDVRFLGTRPQDWREYLLRDGDLLATRYNGNPALVGAAARVNARHGCELVYPDKLIRLRISIIDSEWVAMALGTGVSRAAIDAVTKTTSGQVGISGGDLKRIPIPLAPVEEINVATRLVNTLIAGAGQVADRAQELAASFRSLDSAVLAAAFRGELVSRDDSSPAVLATGT